MVSSHPARADSKPYVMRRAGIHNGLCLSVQPVEPLEQFGPVTLEKRSLLKITAPAWIKRVGVLFDLPMPQYPDGAGPCQRHPDRFPVRGSFAGVGRKHPTLPPKGVPVFLGHPVRRLVRMPAPCPFPQGLPDRRVRLCKGPGWRGVPMIVRPTQDDRVEFAYQQLLALGPTRSNYPSDLCQRPSGLDPLSAV